MNCGFARERLWAWVHDEDDDEASRAEVAAHVRTCPECHTAANEMRAVLDDLSDLSRAGPLVADDTPPEDIPGYRLGARLGHGAMGIVFEAEQINPPRPVALKVIRGGRLADPFHIRLFQREVQTLARLVHPGIAAIFDAGETPDGRHYYAMERVAGKTLSEYVRSAGDAGAPLSITDRLRLFQRICDAVSYAHQRGVIHRDLKPANILITADGSPKVLDFGLARLVERDPGASFRTETGHMLGTLAYMSPEQARGDTDDIDVRSDVYALGVILYELTTGGLPYELHGVSLLEGARRVAEQPPQHPTLLNARLAPEVATITLKALEKDPDRRYASVAALSDDIERYLTGHPILARRPNAMYKFRKLVARHKLPAALLTILLAAILTFTGVTMWQSARVASERNRALREAHIAERINAVLQGMLASPDPWQSGRRDTTVLEVLDRAAERIATDLIEEPLIAAAVGTTLGRTYRSFGEYDSAERVLRAALAQRRENLTSDHPDIAESLNALGELIYLRAEYDEAERLMREALHFRRNESPQFPAEIAQLVNNLALIRSKLGDADQARQLCREALAIRDRLVDQADADPAHTRQSRAAVHNDRAQTRNNLAGMLRAGAGDDRARLLEARDLYAAALDERLEFLGENHPDVAKMHNNFGLVLQDLGEYDAAAEHIQAAIRILQRGLGEDHPFIARGLNNLATLRLEQGRLADAEQLCREALTMRERLDGVSDDELRGSRELLDLILAERDRTHPTPP